jgi:hypothetical protein
MAIEVQWQNAAHTILRYNFVGDWTWEDYFPVLLQGRAMMAQEAHQVCILNDFTQTQQFPRDFLSKARNVASTRPTNTGRIVFIAPQTILVRLLQTLQQLSPDWAAHYFHESTETAALAHLDRWLQERTAT